MGCVRSCKADHTSMNNNTAVNGGGLYFSTSCVCMHVCVCVCMLVLVDIHRNIDILLSSNRTHSHLQLKPGRQSAQYYDKGQHCPSHRWRRVCGQC